MESIGDEVNRAVQRFVAQIVELACRAALDEVHAVLAGAAQGARSAEAAHGELSLRSSSRRNDAELAAVSDRLMTCVREHPGLHVEQISRLLGTPRRELIVPIRSLLATGALVIKGRARSTSYFAKPLPDQLPPFRNAVVAVAEPAVSPAELVTHSITDGEQSWGQCLTGVLTFARKLRT